jgi:hypothetical protein
VRPSLPAVLLGVAAAAIAAAPAFAKEDVEATLTSTIPVDASRGQEITISWRLESVDDEGRRRPFGAAGVFVQLESRSGGLPSVGFASGDGGRDGAFEALVVVPDGGIGGIAIGLGGTVSDATGTRPSYVYFPVTNSPLPAVTDPSPPDTAPTPTPAEPVAGSGDSSGIWIAALAPAGVAALAGIIVLVLRRRRPAAAS